MANLATWDAGAALGLHYLRQLRLVILPQALRIAIPPTVGFLVQLLKSTAVTSVIGFRELTRIGEVLAGENGDRWDDEALEELRAISGHVVDQGWIDELGNGRLLRTLYEKSCAYRDLRLSEYAAAPSRDELSTLRLPDLMQAYGEVLSGRGPGVPPPEPGE